MAQLHGAPEVVLFLSVDVVGSTAYKVRAAQEGRDWVAAFSALFMELPLVYVGEIAHVFDADDEVPLFGVWKVMGDEMLLIAVPRSRRELGGLLEAFAATLERVQQRFSADYGITLAAGAWAAEVGQRNQMIEIPEMFGGFDGLPYRDFLGPDVDLGFRLRACARPAELLASPNLVETLLAVDASHGLHFHERDRMPLRGVAGEFPFPMPLIAVRARSSGEAQATPADLLDRLEAFRAELGALGVPVAQPVYRAEPDPSGR